MKKIVALVALTVIACALLCACRCYVYDFDWNIGTIYHAVTYANGETLMNLTDARISIGNPIGFHSGEVNIKFNEDGTVLFKPYGSELLYGTYEMKHDGLKATNFTVTFENGEKIENGHAIGYYGNDELEFDFRGVKYHFDSYRSDSITPEEHRSYIEDIVNQIRYEMSRNDQYLHNGEVILSENERVLTSEWLDEKIDLYQKGLAVTAVHITDNNELIVLDDLREGECVFLEQYKRNEKGEIVFCGVVIYYVDPLPSPDLPQEPEKYNICDVFSELEYYRDHPENIRFTMICENIPAKPGDLNKYLNVTDTDSIINAWLRDFFDITLYESLEGAPYNIEEQHKKWGVKLVDTSGEHASVEIYMECGYIYHNARWYEVFLNGFPTWDGGGATYYFSYNDPIVRSQDGEKTFSIANLEFKRDYTPDDIDDSNKITLLGEVGEIIVYSPTYFYFDGNYYTVIGEISFLELFE